MIALHYVSDRNGKTQSVQLPLTDWEKLSNPTVGTSLGNNACKIRISIEKGV